MIMLHCLRLSLTFSLEFVGRVGIERFEIVVDEVESFTVKVFYVYDNSCFTFVGSIYHCFARL
jgi:hypothetical protein